MRNGMRFTAFNFGIQLVWGAVLAVSLQSRCIELTHGDGVQAYAWIAAIGASLAAVVQVVIGRLSDHRFLARGHRREFYVVGVLASIPMIAWFFTTRSFAACVFAFLCLQIAMNVASGPYQAAIADHVPEERRAQTSSWMSAFQSLGAAAGLLIAGFLRDQKIVAASLCTGLFASFAITWHYLRALPAADQVERQRLLPGAFSILLISRGLINTGFYIMLGFLLFFVRDSLGVHDPQVQRTQTAILFLTFTLIAVIGAIVAGRIAEHRDKRRVIGAFNAVSVAALCLLAGAQNSATALGAAAVAGFAWGAFASIDWALACTVLPRASMATAMGIWNTASVVPQIVAPLIAAPVIAACNALLAGSGPRCAMLAAALAFAVGTLYLQRLPPTVANTRFVPISNKKALSAIEADRVEPETV